MVMLLQAGLDRVERLRVPAQRAAQHRVEAHAVAGEPCAQAFALARAEGAELVIVGRAERGLAVAHEVERSHRLAL
jgi:hypothetical protein